MKNMAGIFTKVSFEQWQESYQVGDQREIYDGIQMPSRATEGSAGYDFYAPMDHTILKDQEILIPTGIRVKMNTGWVLCLFPRSGLGFKYGIHLKNTVGIIDSDYFHADNEGHIFVKLHNPSDDIVEIPKGKGFAQGIFLPFGITENDHPVKLERTGGFGSTDAGEFADQPTMQTLTPGA